MSNKTVGRARWAKEVECVDCADYDALTGCLMMVLHLFKQAFVDLVVQCGCLKTIIPSASVSEKRKHFRFGVNLAVGIRVKLYTHFSDQGASQAGS